MSCDNPIIQAITPEDFKLQFWRDFSYKNNWLIGSTYSLGEQIFYDVDRKFYQSLVSANIGNLPTDITKWKELSNIGLVSDLDITNAYAEACISFNEGLFSDDEIKLVYLYLSAHYLVNDLNAGGQNSSGSSGMVSSRSVGNVSEAYAIPQKYLDNINYIFYTKSSYGLKYLNLVVPRLAGNIKTVSGATNA